MGASAALTLVQVAMILVSALVFLKSRAETAFALSQLLVGGADGYQDVGYG